MTKSIERSVKDRVKQIAQAQNKPFAVIWQSVILERWLVRLYNSKHRDTFIFKGGMCLDQYLSIHRETKDLDFLAKGLSSDLENVSRIIDDINQFDANDGIKFSSAKVNSLNHPHMNYPGFEISMRAELGQTRTPVRIDIGIGDIVKPENITIQLSENKGSPLFEKEIQLWAYPVETIFTEKLETAVKRDALNSRMKDYHDLILLIQSNLLDAKKTLTAVKQTFKNRKTDLKPIGPFSKSQMDRLENLWTIHQKKSNFLKDVSISASFKEVLDTVNDYVIKLI